MSPLVWGLLALYAIVAVAIGRSAAWSRNSDGKWVCQPTFAFWTAATWPLWVTLVCILAPPIYAAKIVWKPLQHLFIPAKVRKDRAVEK